MMLRLGVALSMAVLTAACASDGSNSDVASSPAPPFDEAFSIGLTEDRLSAVLRFQANSNLHQSRGVGWRLEEWNGTKWDTEWILAGGAFTPEEWAAGNYAIGDVEFFGPGPDVIAMPRLDTAGPYRICHGLEAANSTPGCATVPLESTEPNAAATATTQFVTTTAGQSD